MRFVPFSAALSAAALCLSISSIAHAHGFAGKRFFPATLTMDDPFTQDELDFQASRFTAPDENGVPVRSTGLSAELGKRITRRFGISIGGDYQHLRSDTGETASGFGNLELGARYAAYVNGPRETAVAIGLNAEIGGTGARGVGADPFTTLSPTLYFGRGLGDLPHAARYLRPLAFTGIVAPNLPTDPAAPRTVSWGFTAQYNLEYLQAFVKDIGLRAPLNHVIPLIEMPMQTCLSQDCAGQSTGTINPGLIWFGRSGQIGLEMPIPVNARSGTHPGVLLQVHFYLDDLFPHSIGAPLFGRN